MTSRMLTAAEAAAALGVRRATLYAYVSRGLLRSEASLEGRARRYPAADVEALRQRVEGRRDPPALARGALTWGVPVLDSALTLIAGGRVFYRGHEVVALARGGESLERVAALLWLGSLGAPLPAAAALPATALFPAAAPPAHGGAAALAGMAGARSWRPFQRLLALLPLATAEDAAAYDLRPEAVAAAGARLLPLLARLAAGGAHSRSPARARRQSAGGGRPGPASPSPRAAAILAGGWAPAADRERREEIARLLDAALVVSADHELNVSAFTARCVASARAPLAAVVLGALAALGGSRHGGESDRVEALLEEMVPARLAGTGPRRAPASRRMPGAGVRDRLADRLRRGEGVPGFGHPLYPDGDPRGLLLLELAAARRPRSPEVDLALELAGAALDLLGERPTLDFGLVTLARALALPAGAALGIFAVGRAAGWIAHALEQYADPRLIRPRARYTGPEPPASAAGGPRG